MEGKIFQTIHYNAQVWCTGSVFGPPACCVLQGKVFVFDKVLRPNVTQEYVYTVTAKPIVAGKYIIFENYTKHEHLI